MNIDLSQIQALLRILEKRDVTEFEFEDEHVRLRLVRGAPPSAAPTVGAPTTHIVAAAPPQAEPHVVASDEPASVHITSP
ncbi:MAG TPA: acetyl-CoA carboxylase, biotin carboxyl carrier protein, partial [Polyangium sp.]|nr:acetyl-CoA carboxylase, biotin carboxyl carrier protein [Polyangium sp.]